MNIINDIKDRLSIVDIIGSRIKLAKKGNRHVGRCPFHNEKTGSFYVDDAKGFYYCFGCQATGDIFTFIQEIDGREFKDVLEDFAKLAGVTIPKSYYNNDSNIQNVKHKYLDILNQVTQYYNHNLYSNMGKKALDYLYQRGVNDESIKKFNLGYSLNHSNALLNLYKEQANNNLEKDLLNIGLRYQNQESSFDFFRDRIMFPIYNTSKSVVGFGARAMSATSNAKYINSKDSNLFHKKNILYGLSHIDKKYKQVIIVEGYLDVISLHQFNYPVAVAPLGTAVTSEHILLLKKYSTKPLFCFDGDSAGLRATEKTIKLILPHIGLNLLPKFIQLPTGHDPDSFLKQYGRAEFNKLIKNAKLLSQVLIDLILQDCDVKVAESIYTANQKLQDYLNLIKDSDLKFNIEQSYRRVLKQKIFNSTSNKKNINYTNSNITDYDDIKRYSEYKIVLTLFAILVKYPDLYHKFDEHINKIEIEDKDLQRQLDACIHILEQEEHDASKLHREPIYDTIKKLLYSDTIRSSIDSIVHAETFFYECYDCIVQMISDAHDIGKQYPIRLIE